MLDGSLSRLHPHIRGQRLLDLHRAEGTVTPVALLRPETDQYFRIEGRGRRGAEWGQDRAGRERAGV